MGPPPGRNVATNTYCMRSLHYVIFHLAEFVARVSLETDPAQSGATSGFGARWAGQRRLSLSPFRLHEARHPMRTELLFEDDNAALGEAKDQDDGLRRRESDLQVAW